MKKPKKFDYNLAVIGGGSGGLVSAYIAAAVKAKVVLIEKHKMGGDCLNTGCVPSKALIRTAKILSYTNRAQEYGILQLEAKFDFAEVMERVQNVVSQVAPHDSIERYTDLGVDCLQGEAKLLSPYHVEVRKGDQTEVITAKNIVIATGARPMAPPIPGLAEMDYLTSDTIWDLRKKPEKLLVLGGGPIGCEMTQAFTRLGVNTTQVQMTSHLMDREDTDVCELVEDSFRKDGVNLLLNHKALRFEKNGDQKILIAENLTDGQQGQEVEIPFTHVLLALGRKANTSGFGLEELGVELRDNGTIEADPFLRTNIPNIYCCGDVTGPYQFTHTAAHQAWYVAVNALFSGIKKFKVDYSIIPWSTFVEPEVARVGLNEKEAQQQNTPYEVTKYDLDDLDRAIADSDAHGFVKVLTVPGKDKILGATIVGNHAGDLIAEFILAMKYDLGLNKILGTIHIYPTLAEANKYAAGNWKKDHAPKGLLKWVERLHRFRRG